MEQIDIKPTRNLFISSSLLSLVTCLICWICWSCNEVTTNTIDDVVGGSESSSTPLIDSNTNWLLSCVEDIDCGEGERCSCGSCVIPCEAERGCAVRPGEPRPPQIECSMAAPVSEIASCEGGNAPPMESICLPRCEVTQDCPPDLLCHEGTCKLPRRGQRACEEARRCVEGGGDPEMCLEGCSHDEPRMSMPLPPEDIRECEERCLTELSDPVECQQLCMSCEERCEFLEPAHEDECEARCNQN